MSSLSRGETQNIPQFDLFHLLPAMISSRFDYLQEGVTTDHIDRQVHQMIIENGAYPSPLNYGVLLNVLAPSPMQATALESLELF